MARQTFLVETEDIQRIDHVLEKIVPQMGLRGRRRLCDEGYVYIGDKQAISSHKVRRGDIIYVEIPSYSERIEFSTSYEDLVTLHETEDFLAIEKPAGMHSQAIVGKYDYSLEILLKNKYPESILLNRLDRASSGIVLLAKSAHGQKIWKIAQDNKLAVKKYVAIVVGKVKKNEFITTHLDNSKNEIVSYSDKKGEDSLRFTSVNPIATFDSKDFFNLYEINIGQPYLSLVGCTLYKGVRHQVRAHMASIGYPLLGDIKYMYRQLNVDSEMFYLHHTHFNMPNFTVYSKAPWLPDAYEKAVSAWINDE